jgi:exopolysaccharide biosynthesis polyprenyl glycosylphosphotransferase
MIFQQQFYIIANLLMAVDAIIMIVTGYIAYSISLEVRVEGLVMAWHDFLGCVLFSMFANNYFMAKFGFYSLRRFPSTLPMMGAVFFAVALDFIVLSAGVILASIDPFSRVYLVVHFLSALSALIVTRVILYYYLDQRALTPSNSQQILLVGSQDRIAAVATALDRQRSWGHQVAGSLRLERNGNAQASQIPVLGELSDFDRVLREREIDEVIFALPRDFRLNLDAYIQTCKRIGVAFRIVPAMFDFTEASLRVETIQGIPTLTDHVGSAGASGLLYKKILDWVAGFSGFIGFLLLYPIVGLAIKLDSPGPVLFKQRRVGMHGRVFTLYKFRSMVADAESRRNELLKKSEMAGPIFKMERDPRITRVGRFLRKTSIDEFPQFMNVLKGEMSLVGTRPPTLDEVKQYEDWHRRRISIKPGITGLWQISGRNKITNFADVVKLDLQYIDRWRFRRDLAILWKTIWAVLTGKGAE